jgi:hypothetical protein
MTDDDVFDMFSFFHALLPSLAEQRAMLGELDRVYLLLRGIEVPAFDARTLFE